MALTTTLTSDALYSITYAWAMAFAPHVYKVISVSLAGYKWDNTAGRGNISKASGKVSPEAYARAQRADMAHANGQESWPLFAVAVLAAGITGVDRDTTSNAAKLYLGTRFAYNIVYIYGTNQGVAALRTLLFLGSTYSCVNLIRKAAQALAAKGL